METQKFWKKIPRSIHHAADGLGYVLKTQQNARVHGAMAAGVVIAGVLFNISRVEWLILILTINLVFTAEIFNTALEFLVDIVSPEIRPAAKICKDVSAAGVLIAAAGSVLVGAIIFGPRLWRLLQEIIMVLCR